MCLFMCKDTHTLLTASNIYPTEVVAPKYYVLREFLNPRTLRSGYTAASNIKNAAQRLPLSDARLSKSSLGESGLLFCCFSRRIRCGSCEVPDASPCSLPSDIPPCPGSDPEKPGALARQRTFLWAKLRGTCPWRGVPNSETQQPRGPGPPPRPFLSHPGWPPAGTYAHLEQEALSAPCLSLEWHLRSLSFHTDCVPGLHSQGRPHRFAGPAGWAAATSKGSDDRPRRPAWAPEAECEKEPAVRAAEGGWGGSVLVNVLLGIRPSILTPVASPPWLHRQRIHQLSFSCALELAA